MPPRKTTGRELKSALLARADLPAGLQDLHSRILPEKRYAELAEMVRTGKLDPLCFFEPFPLLSPVTAILGQPDWKEGLKALFSAAPEKAGEAKVCCFRTYVGSSSRKSLSLTEYTGENTFWDSPVSLVQYFTDIKKDFFEIAALFPDLLYQKNTGSDGETLPAFFEVALQGGLTVQKLERLRVIAGSAIFLDCVDSKGRTLFYRFLQQAQVRDVPALEAVTWMLMHKPDLANKTDNLGWTPLDRLLVSSGGEYDTPMGRLLVASGARLNRQVAPKFNLAAEIERIAGETPLNKVKTILPRPSGNDP